MKHGSQNEICRDGVLSHGYIFPSRFINVEFHTTALLLIQYAEREVFRLLWMGFFYYTDFCAFRIFRLVNVEVATLLGLFAFYCAECNFSLYKAFFMFFFL